MKKSIVSATILLASVLLFSTTLLADVIPPNSHQVSRCVKVVNLNGFPDIVLIGHFSGPMLKSPESYQIKNKVCLTKGYKFNSLSIYWNTKDKTDIIDPSNLVLENVETYGGAVDNKNHLVQENIEYSIAGFSEGRLILYKSRQISEYNNSEPTKIEIFENPLGNINNTNATAPTPAQPDTAHTASSEPPK